MNKEQNPNEEKKRARRLVFGAVAMLLISAGVFGGLSYLQSQARDGNDTRKSGSYTRPKRVVTEADKALAAARLVKVQMLRDKWRPWAEEHKEDLRAMLQGDQGAMSRVWEQIPDVGPKGHNELALSVADVEGGATPFSWWAIDKAVDPKLVAESKRIAYILEVMAQKRKQDFSMWHDIELSQSSGSGPKRLRLLASGRVLEDRIIDNPDRGVGKPAAARVYREVFPAYDFLK